VQAQSRQMDNFQGYFFCGGSFPLRRYPALCAGLRLPPPRGHPATPRPVLAFIEVCACPRLGCCASTKSHNEGQGKILLLTTHHSLCYNMCVAEMRLFFDYYARGFMKVKLALLLSTLCFCVSCNNVGDYYCGDNEISDEELCDGSAEHHKTCYDYDNTVSWKAGGKPDCNATCDGLLRGTCEELSTDALCGDSVISGAELCDGTLEHGKTCADFDSSKSWKAGGVPGCNATCDGLVQGTCELRETTAVCGDGFITDDEICDGTIPHGKTCADFDSKTTWLAGGTPACGADCVSLTQGTCVKAFCGNGQVDEGEVCDGKNLNGKSCESFFEQNPYFVYKGEPACSEDCQTVLKGTCEATRCGNGIIELEHGEKCDFNEDGSSRFLGGTPPTCSEYISTIDWAEGGTPACSKDCKAYAKGSCVEAAGPKAGILTCEFTSLEVDEATKTLKASAKIELEEGITQPFIAGRLSCGVPTVETYAWNHTSSARAIECSECEANHYRYIADMNYGHFGAGEYACGFLMNAEAGQNSFYLCPTTNGYPAPQGIASSEYVHKFTIEAEEIEGTVIARWDFDALENKSEHLSVKADSGTLAEHAVITHSAGKAMTAYTGTQGYGSQALGTNDFSLETTLAPNTDPHFKLQFSTVGASGIHVQFKVAGSGNYDKKVAIAYVNNNNPVVVGSELIVSGSNVFTAFPRTALDTLANKTNAELRIYGYGLEDKNSTLRVDEIIVTADVVN